MRLIKILLVVLVIASMVVTTASADSPHFVRADAGFQGSSQNLNVSWKEAGLGNNQAINYIASANATAIYACINGGGNHPKAANKETVSGPVSASGQFASGKNGQITASLTLSPPGPGGFSCPPGQRLEVAKVTYTNVAITDATNGITEAIQGAFCRQLIGLPEFSC